MNHLIESLGGVSRYKDVISRMAKSLDDIILKLGDSVEYGISDISRG